MLQNHYRIEENWKEIYPPQMVLTKENEDDTKALFLDLLIEKGAWVGISAVFVLKIAPRSRD